jgi:predicted  nucleic acid-binding Zn-ribbon protein
MSLERIDRYIKELTAVKEYENVCQQLNDARKMLVELQKNNLLYKNTIETQSSAAKDLSERLAQKQEEIDDLKKGVVAQIRNLSKDLDYLKNKLSENQSKGALS